MATEEEREALKPCPFCGKLDGDDELIFTADRDLNGGGDREFTIRCVRCGILMSDEYRGELVKRWNRRAPDPDQSATISRLTAERDELAAWKAHIVDHQDRAKRPFSDRFAQAVIASQVKTIDELRGRLNGWFVKRDGLVAEVGHLREALTDIADNRGVCGTCGVLATGPDGGTTDCNCKYPTWLSRDPVEVARAALANTAEEGRP